MSQNNNKTVILHSFEAMCENQAKITVIFFSKSSPTP